MGWGGAAEEGWSIIITIYSDPIIKAHSRERERESSLKYIKEEQSL